VSVAQELVSGVGEHHAACMAVEELDTQTLLELLDGLGNHRLGHVERGQGAGNRTRLGHGDEVDQLLERDPHGGNRFCRCPVYAGERKEGVWGSYNAED
jgi:hypothetical protein